jgi:hypothetical protein
MMTPTDFIPPSLVIAPDTGEANKPAAPLPLWIDLYGEPLHDAQVEVRLGWTSQAISVHAEGRYANPVCLPEIAAGSARFWQQDHVELRLHDPQGDGELTLPVIIALDGRWQDKNGFHQKPEAAKAKAGRKGDQWHFDLTLPIGVFSLKKLKPGQTLRGLISHQRWGQGYCDIYTSSPVELGFAHASCFGEWLLAPTPNPVVLEAITRDTIILENHTGEVTQGRLRVVSTCGGRAPESRLIALTLQPGKNTIPFTPSDEAFAFTHHTFSWVTTEATSPLGAITLKAPVPPVSGLGQQAHPGLLFDSHDLDAMRAKLKQAPFCDFFPERPIPDDLLSGDDLPEPEALLPMDFTDNCMGWFRVGRETMLRDGEGNRRRVAHYLWSLHSKEGQQAWRDLVKSVIPTPEQLTVLKGELNALLTRRDLYQPDAFAEVELPDEARAFLAEGVEQLDDYRVARLNRILYQSAVECIHNYRMDLPARPGQCFRAWLRSNDPRLIATATRAVISARHTILSHHIHLHEGMAAQGIALAFDAFYPYLSESDRAAWKALLKRFLELYLKTAEPRSWTLTTLANANPVGNGGCGLAALVMLPYEPELAQAVLARARRFIRNWLTYCCGTDGGNTEGAQYWQYGLENYLLFAQALERTTGHDEGLLEHPAIRNTINMVKVSLCNDGALCGVNDTIPMPVGGAIAWFVASRFQDKFALWYGDHALRWKQHRESTGGSVTGNYMSSLLEALLYRPAVPEVTEQPPLPTAIVLPSIEYAMIRSGENYDCRWTAGLKGSRPPYTHHNQADTGALFIDLRGERMIIDPGYYKGAATDHALPLINGKGPQEPTTLTGWITACQSRDDMRYLAVDSTRAYSGLATRVVRHLVMLGDEAMVLLDDIEADATVTAQYTCGGPTESNEDGRVLVSGQKARLTLHWNGPDKLTPVLHPERSLKDVHWGYGFADCRLFPVTLDYQPQVAQPLITVFLDATNRDDRKITFHRDNQHCQVVLPSGRKLSFSAAEGTWRPLGFGS